MFASIALATRQTQTARARATLRRADWRFLIPTPPEGQLARLALVGGPPELGERLLEIGVARQVTRELDRSADATIVYADAHVALDAAVASVPPTGALYLEVDRRRHWGASPARVLKQLARAGLRDGRAYWVKPSFARCEMYLPLDDPGALAWYMGALFTATSAGRELLGAAIRAATRLRGDRLARLVPCYAVSALGPSHPSAHPGPLGDPSLPFAAHPALRPLVLTGGEDELSRVAVVAFERGRPRAVLKCARLAARNEHTEREQRVEGELRAALPDALRESLPRPLALLDWGGISVGVESCAPGRILSSRVGQRSAPLARKVEDLRRATDWLIAFHRQTRAGERDAAEWCGGLLEQYEAAFGPDTAERELFARLRERAGWIAALPVVWQHYGFGEWNVYRAGDRMTVIDWEGAEPGLPLADLLFFAVQCPRTVLGLRGSAAQRAGFRRLFVERTRDDATAAVWAAIGHYADALGIDRRAVPILVVLTWVQRALYHHEGRADVYAATADARARNRWVGHVALLAEGADRLLAEGTTCGS